MTIIIIMTNVNQHSEQYEALWIMKQSNNIQEKVTLNCL